MSTLVLSLTNPDIERRSGQIRAKNVPWENYEKADVISKGDVDLLAKLKEGPIPSDAAGEYADLFVRLLGNLSRSDHVQALLVFLSDYLTEDELRVRFFSSSAYDALTKFFDSSDLFIREKSLAIAGTLLAVDTAPPAPVVDSVLKQITARIEDPKGQDSGIQDISNVLRSSPVRKAVLESHSSLVDKVMSITHDASPQRLYDVVFVLWLLSFEPLFVDTASDRYSVFPYLADILKQTNKEKVVRISVMVLTNLSKKHANLCAMVGFHLSRVLQHLLDRQWSDEDIRPEVESLDAALRDTRLSLTTFGEYTAELRSGELEWSPIHSNETFWRDNAHRFAEDDHFFLKELANLLKTSQNPTTLAVALNDLTRIVNNYEPGRRDIGRLGVKELVMQFVLHDDVQVKFQALMLLQRLLTHSWE